MNFAIATKCIIYNCDNKILILKKTKEENKEDINKNLFDLPGGRVEYKETLHDCIKREVKEETNLDILDIKIIDANTVIRKDNLHLVIITYKATVKNKEIKLSKEHSNYFWMNNTEILSNKNIPFWIKQLINTSKRINK